MDIGNGQILGNRASQQDYFATINTGEHSILILADGIGGMSAGDEASYIAVKSCKQFLEKRSIDNVAQSLAQCAEFANRAIKSASDKIPNCGGMGTTLIVCIITQDRFTWLSIGDSLIYRLQKNALSRLNALHTRMVQLQTQVLDGSITQREADSKPDRDSITSALTGAPIAEMDIQSIERTPEDLFVVSSDGIDTLRNGAIRSHLLNYETAQLTCDALIESVQAANNPYQDNCTVLVVGPDPVERKVQHSSSWLYGLLFALFLCLLTLAIWYFVRSESKTDLETVDTKLDETPPVVEPGFIERDGRISQENDDNPEISDTELLENEPDDGAAGSQVLENDSETSKPVTNSEQEKSTETEEKPKSSDSFFTNRVEDAETQKEGSK